MKIRHVYTHLPFEGFATVANVFLIGISGNSRDPCTENKKHWICLWVNVYPGKILNPAGCTENYSPQTGGNPIFGQ